MTGRVLLIDPHAGNRMLLKSMLIGAYCDVASVDRSDPVHVVQEAGRADLVFLDGSDGVPPALTRLKRTQATAYLPVIVTLPPDSSPAALVAAFNAGADDVCVRPHAPLELVARVRQLIRLKRMQDELALRDRTARHMMNPHTLLQEPAATYAPPPAPLVVLDTGGPGTSGLAAAFKRNTARPVETVATLERLAARCASGAVAAAVVSTAGGDGGDRGLRLIARHKSSERCRDTPLLVLVDRGSGAAVRALDLGADDAVPADASVAEMLARVDALDRRRLCSDRLRASLRSGMQMAMTDPLTGLYNRRYADAHIPRLLSQSLSAHRPFTLMMLDLDKFKQVNDRYGHAAGDDVLRSVAARLRDGVRGVDLVARIGGEEFMIALPDTPLATGAAVAERLRDAVAARPVPAEGDRAIPVTISVGVAVAAPDGSEAYAALQKRADEELYRSKHAGRNCVHLSPEAA